MSTLGRVSKFVRQLFSDQRGNVAIIAALALPVAIAVGGGAVDFHRSSLARAQAQDALDLAAISAASSKTVVPRELERMALEYLSGNIEAQLMNPNPTVKVIDPKISGFKMTLSGSVKPLFLGLVGISTLPIEVETVVERGAVETIELALVLDNTWSMSYPAGGGTSKIAALKDASKLLIDALMTKADAEVKIGVVPYGNYVNVGMNNRNASWLTQTDDVTTTEVAGCRKVSKQKTCVRDKNKKWCPVIRDGYEELRDCTPETCTVTDVPEREECYPASTSVARWLGCVSSRSGINRLNDRVGTPYPGIRGTNCLTPITPLTSNRSTVTAAINSLIVNIGGYKPETYIPAGLIWGVNVLSPGEPFTEAAPYGQNNTQPRKIMVLMTDGANTLQYVAARHASTAGGSKDRQKQIAQTDSDTAEICNYAKSNGIEVFTVALAVSSDTARDLLRGCATDADHYFDAQDTNALSSAFAGIAASINKVRIVS